MRRRDFVTVLGGAAILAPLPSGAQQSERVRLIAMLLPFDEGVADGRSRLETVREGLRRLGWSEGRNLRIDVRWLGRDPQSNGLNRAMEVVQLRPEVILAASTFVVAALMRATSTIPIVFVAVADPVGNDFVASLARPGGNITGFANFEPSFAGKWIQLLKEVAPGTSRVSVLYNPQTSPGGGVYFLRSFESAGPSFGVTTIPVPVHSIAEIESVLSAAADAPNSGVAVLPDSFLLSYRDQIVDIAAHHRLPAVYPFREWVDAGGLLSYGPDVLDTYRRAPDYIDRILRGARASELPVQLPTKYELVINLKTARSFGLTIQQSLLVSADEVIE